MKHRESVAGAFESEELPPGVTRDDIEALLRFESELAEEDRQKLESTGVEFVSDGDDLVRVGTIYLTRIQWEALGELAAHEQLVRAEATWTPSFEYPLEKTSELVGATQLRRDSDFELDGEGTVIGDIDSGFYIYHPHLFRADAGWYRWRDANADGDFDPGTDGVDLNGDGAITGDEQLEVLDATVVRGRDQTNEDGELQTRRDWLYVDTNGDGERNVGPSDGYTERDPAYGEPLFVADDADRDGRLQPGEKLVRLGSSKFAKVVEGDQTFERGENLIEIGPTDREDRSYHGTAVASVLAGGQPRFHDRVGLAPSADLVGYSNSAGDGGDFGEFGLTQQYIDDAIETEVDILLHEWSDIVATPQDGSTNIEQAIDRAREEGILQVNPAGNLNVAKKHVERQIEPGDDIEIPFVVDEGYRRGGELRAYRAVWVGLRWRADHAPTFELVGPSGESVELDAQQRAELGSHTVSAESDVSPRGTRQLLFGAWNRQERLAQGTWRIRVSNVDKSDTVYGRIIDRYSSWNVGIRWKNPTRDRGTLTLPATADSAIGVAAYGARREETRRGSSSEIGELRNYSGRGPRIDGARAVDITGPADPLAALGVNSDWIDRGFGRSWFRHFGGTSGAGPHIAASISLLQQRYPERSADRIEQQLLESADPDGLTREFGAAPNRGWGFGKVDVYEAVSERDDAPEFGSPPVAQLDVEIEGSDIVFNAMSSRDPENQPLSFRFDFDYDGEWETEWTRESTQTMDANAVAREKLHRARLSVRDRQGNRHGAVESYQLPSAPVIDAGEGTPDVGPDIGWTDGGGPVPNRISNGGEAGGSACGGCHTAPSRNSPVWLMTVFVLFAIRRRRE